MLHKMLIRNFQKKRNFRKLTKNILIIVIGAIIVFKVTNFVYYEITKDSNLNWQQELSFYWEISVENNFPLYTHKISNTKGDYVFLKSSYINLNSYSGYLEVFGKINEIRSWTPILDVESLKFPDQWLVLKNNNYLFVKDMIYLQFEQQTDLSAIRDDKEIHIYYDNRKIGSIERFVCSRALRQKDCSYLIEDYSNSQKDNFDSYWWYTYYKHWTGLRTMFDWKIFGYIFKDIEEENMLNLSHLIRLIDSNFVVANKKDILTESCNKIWANINQIGHTSIQYDDNNEIIVIIDIDKDKSCKNTINIRDQRTITNTEIIEK